MLAPECPGVVPAGPTGSPNGTADEVPGESVGGAVRVVGPSAGGPAWEGSLWVTPVASSLAAISLSV